MSSDMTGRTGRTPSRPPVGSRGGGGNAGGTIAIVVTVVALILGFVILRRIDDNTGATVSGTTGPISSGDVVDTVDPLTTIPATTIAPQVFKGTLVQVANSSRQNGTAGMMTTALQGAGFDMTTAANGTTEPKLDISKVIYKADDPAALAVATTLATILGGLTVEAAGVPIPVETGAWAAGSSVMLLLGNDLAGKTLDQIAGLPVGGATSTPVSP